ncbi:MAG: hypothetical protein A2Z16_16195 [Chloroflexi bacterium RBG_16_54_18]|nr:MAG: hypothetical protein A2Z16_16195 [Chloroflexi bacterium RBG_16_54_18]
MSSDSKNNRSIAEKEKRFVAMTSVLAAVFLTSMKIVVGLLTGSLGILAEAAHSGLDLVAAGVTYFAVRLSGRPADAEHTYGYGKVENLSALFETFLLLVTCVWIIYEAIQRLFFTSVEVEASFWAFLVMGVSIFIDFGRSRALSRAAQKYNSQALEADALHFSTDIWSSAVVIVGLFFVRLSDRMDISWLAKADAVAAIGVAVIVVYVSVQLGRRTIKGLVDAIPPGLQDQLVRAVKVEGVLDVKQVRVRKSGPETFVDVSLVVKHEMAFEHAHIISKDAEDAIKKVLPGADVLIYLIPSRSESDSIFSAVRRAASRNDLSIHGIRLYNAGGERTLELHLEVSELLRLDEAHQQASDLEAALNKSLPGIDHIVTHIEPTGEKTIQRDSTPEDERMLIEALNSLPGEIGLDFQPHEVRIHRTNGELSLSFHCLMDEHIDISRAHALTEQMERLLRAKVDNLGRVIIHTEPDHQENF